MEGTEWGSKSTLGFRMRKVFTFVLLLFFLVPLGFAQNMQEEEEREQELQAVITGPSDIAVGRTIILDASASLLQGEKVTYRWYIGKSLTPISHTVEAVFTPEKAETLLFRLLLQSRVDGKAVTSESFHRVIVYKRKVVLVADRTVSSEKLLLHERSAQENGVFLRILQSPESSASLGTEEEFFRLLSEQSSVLAGAEAVVFWTDSIAGLQALMRLTERDDERRAGLRNQTIVMITGGGLQTLARTARGPFSVMHPKQILVTRKEAVNPLLSSETIEGFLAEIEQRDIDVLRLDETTVQVRPWNVLTSIVSFMLTRGIGSQTVILLLMLPVIATILAFLKQVIGITTFGLYTPSIIALSLLALGWWNGIVFLLFIIATGYATRAFMRRWRLLYIPKVAIIITVVSITLILLLSLGAFFGITFSRDTIFILLIMSTLSESFLNLKTEEGWKAALFGIFETIAAALLCVWVVQWPLLQSLVLAYPELILLTFLINVLLGRWTGLRLIEYFRFREVFRHLQEE